MSILKAMSMADIAKVAEKPTKTQSTFSKEQSQERYMVQTNLAQTMS